MPIAAETAAALATAADRAVAEATRWGVAVVITAEEKLTDAGSAEAVVPDYFCSTVVFHRVLLSQRCSATFTTVMPSASYAPWLPLR
jgi:hypothetical protein